MDVDNSAAPPSLQTDSRDDPKRWLHVHKHRAGTRGGWATGAFDPNRNRIEIHTHDVEEFVVDVSRIPIDWTRLVVIGIDGHNSELRKRDDPVLLFRHDRTERWIVVEP